MSNINKKILQYNPDNSPQTKPRMLVRGINQHPTTPRLSVWKTTKLRTIYSMIQEEVEIDDIRSS